MSDEYSGIELLVDKAVRGVMKARGITEDDVKRIISNAERTGEKLYRPGGNKFLAKMLINEATVYVEYTAEEGHFKINTAYKHKAVIKE